MVAVAGDCMKKTDALQNREKYDNKTAGFLGNGRLEPHVLLMNKNAQQHVMSH